MLSTFRSLYPEQFFTNASDTVNIIDAIALAVLLLSLLALAASYVIYPIVLRWAAKRYHRPWRIDETQLPSVTMVVAMYNEEEIIPEKVANFLAIDYPPEKLTLLIGSDGSRDRSEELLAAAHAANPRVQWRGYERGGKMRTVNRLLSDVRSDVVVFSDANTMYRPDSIRAMVRHFADAQVGGVCGNLQLIATKSNVGAEGESTYWSFENRMKAWEGGIFTTLGAPGGMYAIRTEVFEAQPEHTTVADDFLLPMRIAARGYRIVFEKESIASETTSPGMKDEFLRKIRVARTSFACIPYIVRLWRRYPRSVRWMLFMHKFLRWAGPFLLLLLALSITILSSHGLVAVWLFYPMIGVLLVVLLGWLLESLDVHPRLLGMPYYFFAVNAALLLGWITLPFQRKRTTWEPSKRG